MLHSTPIVFEFDTAAIYELTERNSTVAAVFCP
jgi:hypothetical protein